MENPETLTNYRATLHGGRVVLLGMASISLRPPEPFTFNKPDEWPRWIKRFGQFRLASGLSTTANQRQVSTLLYLLGRDAEHTLQSMNATAEQHYSTQASPLFILQAIKAWARGYRTWNYLCSHEDCSVCIHQNNHFFSYFVHRLRRPEENHEISELYK